MQHLRIELSEDVGLWYECYNQAVGVSSQVPGNVALQRGTVRQTEKGSRTRGVLKDRINPFTPKFKEVHSPKRLLACIWRVVCRLSGQNPGARCVIYTKAGCGELKRSLICSYAGDVPCPVVLGRFDK